MKNRKVYKMKWKTVALTLICLTISVQSKDIPKCTDDSPCVRFCCENCMIDYDVRDQPGADRFKTDYVVLKGRPCGKMYALEPEDYADDAWVFLAVGMK